MRTSVSLAKHPIHPLLVVFPTALWIFSLICDLIGMSVATLGIWFTVALYTMVGGLVGALAAAAPGASTCSAIRAGHPRVRKQQL
jgi:uncharacterized membrane protein